MDEKALEKKRKQEKIKKIYGNLGAAYDIENTLSQKAPQNDMPYHNYNEDRSYL